MAPGLEPGDRRFKSYIPDQYVRSVTVAQETPNLLDKVQFLASMHNMDLKRLSIVIPTYTLTKDLEEVAITCAGFYMDHPNVWEVIICEDGGMFSPTLYQTSDLYLIGKENVGFTKNVNRGLKMATGDYIAVVNSDTQFSRSKSTGSLLDLCIPGKVTAPVTADGSSPQLMCGHFFVIPRTVLESRGMLDERLHTMCSDADYEDRIKDIFEVVPGVVIYHEMNYTLKATNYLENNAEIIEQDRELFSEIRNNRGLV